MMKMLEADKEKLHSLIISISKLSARIDVLKKKRESLLDKFKNVQLTDSKFNSMN
jgi:hypothetical protein